MAVGLLPGLARDCPLARAKLDRHGGVAMKIGGRAWPAMGVTVSALLLAFVAVGCSSGSSSSTATTLSGHNAFVSQATAVCSNMKAQADALNQTAATLSDESQFGDVLDQNTAILTSALAELKALTPDAGDAAAVSAYLAQLDTLVARTNSVVTALRAGDQAATASARIGQQAAQTAANESAAALGLDVCVIG